MSNEDKWFCVDCGHRYRKIWDAMRPDADCQHRNIHRIGKPRDPVVADIAAIVKGKERPN